jgi:hypothetical protein
VARAHWSAGGTTVPLHARTPSAAPAPTAATAPPLPVRLTLARGAIAAGPRSVGSVPAVCSAPRFILTVDARTDRLIGTSRFGPIRIIAPSGPRPGLARAAWRAHRRTLAPAPAASTTAPPPPPLPDPLFTGSARADTRRTGGHGVTLHTLTRRIRPIGAEVIPVPGLFIIRAGRQLRCART